MAVVLKTSPITHSCINSYTYKFLVSFPDPLPDAILFLSGENKMVAGSGSGYVYETNKFSIILAQMHIIIHVCVFVCVCLCIG